MLAGVDLELRAGTSTAIVGVNGAGKSTLVSLLSRLRDPTGGRITVDGVDVRDLDAARWQRTVAIMPQEPARYPVSAYDNVAFGALEHRDDRAGVQESARLSGFAEVVDTLPAGWDTVLARELPGGVDLSGGQWQRLALARALFATRHGARLLVLDEPTAALDVRGEARFYQQFLDITRELTTVIISHRFGTVRQADVICVLDGGHITERGSHDELVAAGGTYAGMYRTQAARFGARSMKRRPRWRWRRRLVRLAGVLLLDGFRAAPGWMTLVIVDARAGQHRGHLLPAGLPAAGRRRPGRRRRHRRVGRRGRRRA